MKKADSTIYTFDDLWYWTIDKAPEVYYPANVMLDALGGSLSKLQWVVQVIIALGMDENVQFHSLSDSKCVLLRSTKQFERIHNITLRVPVLTEEIMTLNTSSSSFVCPGRWKMKSK